jgi:hypothetical protein
MQNIDKNDHPGASEKETVANGEGLNAFPNPDQGSGTSLSAWEKLLNGRRAATPAEFAKMYGHHPAWGYRKVYAGRVKVIRHAGRLLIPIHEIERFEADTVTFGELKETRSSKASHKNG